MSQKVRWGFDRKAGRVVVPVPLVRPVAYRGPWPIRSHRTLAEVAADEIRANAGVEARGGRTGDPCVESVSRPAAGRSAATTSEIMDVTAGETAPVSDPVSDKDPASLRDPVGAMPPKPVSAPVAVEPQAPLPDCLPLARAPLVKIALDPVPSSMEATAAQWRKAVPDFSNNPLPPVPGKDGKVWCGGCDARVPTWFGRDCISTACALKGIS